MARRSAVAGSQRRRTRSRRTRHPAPGPASPAPLTPHDTIVAASGPAPDRIVPAGRCPTRGGRWREHPAGPGDHGDSLCGVAHESGTNLVLDVMGGDVSTSAIPTGAPASGGPH